MQHNYYPTMQPITTSKEDRIITVQGEGVISLSPDQADINLGVRTTSKDVTTAQKQNATITNAVFKALMEIGVMKEQIQTTNYTISPRYDYVDGKQVFRGYEVQNLFEVTTEELAKVGLIIDTAVQAGANVVNNIAFGVKNQTEFYQRALSLAVVNAFQKAQTIAQTFKATINPVPISVLESDNYNSPVYKTSMLSSESTPIAPGQIEIKASVISKYTY